MQRVAALRLITGLITTEVEHPRVFIDTYSSAYWQLPLHTDTSDAYMILRYSHLLERDVHDEERMEPLCKAASLKRRVDCARTVTRVLFSHYPTSHGGAREPCRWPLAVGRLILESAHLNAGSGVLVCGLHFL